MHSITLDNHSISPNKIICVGRNYLDHINELNNEIPDDMVLFIKPNSAISESNNATSSALKSLHAGAELHYEAEICFIYQQQQIQGIGVGLDLTKREVQSKLKQKGLPWERAKAFDGAAVFSDFVSIKKLQSQLEHTGETLFTNAGQINKHLQLQLSIDGELKQQGSIAQMIYSPQQIEQEVIQHFSLADGDIIMTGTPKGVGMVKPNAIFSASISLAGVTLASAQWLAT